MKHFKLFRWLALLTLLGGTSPAFAGYCEGTPVGISVSDVAISNCVKLPGTFTFATLPNATGVKVGTTAYTSDQGEVVKTATGWAAVTSSGPLPSIANGYILGNYSGSSTAPGAIPYNVIVPIGADPTGVTDSTAAIQACLAASESFSTQAGKQCFVPGGKYKLTSGLVAVKRFTSLVGAGNGATLFTMTGVAASFLTPQPAIGAVWTLTLRDFQFTGDTTSLRVIDETAASFTGEMADTNIENIVSTSGLAAFYLPNIFQSRIANWDGSSINDNVFVINCGPGTTLDTMSVANTGTGKAGYRLAGNCNMISPNGIAGTGNYWAVTGQNTSGSDGFQNDFPGLGTMYASINITNINMEAFITEGIKAETSLQGCSIRGGKFDRSALSTSYTAFMEQTQNAYGATGAGGIPCKLELNNFFAGSGTPSHTGGYLLTTAGGSAFYEDDNGLLTSASVTGYWDAVYGGIVPMGCALANAGSPTFPYSTSGMVFCNIAPKEIFLGQFPIVANGTTFAATGCSISAHVGGITAGQYTSGTTGTCAVTVTLPSVPTAYDCSVHDNTTPADVQGISASTQTSVTFTGTTVSGDVIRFSCTGGAY